MTAPALVALAHGSRDPRSAATVREMRARVRALRPDLRVEVAFLDHCAPSLAKVFDRLVRAGFEEVVVVPLLLTDAFHARVDVPTAVQAGNQRVYQLPPPALPPTPRELPLDVYGFAGRVGELDELDAMLAEDVQASSPVVISAVSGTAGVGKTALAVHWAHRRASQFPDGILYVDLRGYDPDEPVPAGEALAAFLRALGVRGAEIPLEPAERAARYRTLLSGRRMLGSALK